MLKAIPTNKLEGSKYAREGITVHEGLFLGSLIEHIDPARVVEIGSWIGVSTLYIATALREVNHGGVLYAIDPHQGTLLHKNRNLEDSEPILRKNLETFEVESYVQIVRQTSLGALEGWRYKIDVLFLDGAQTVQSLSQDVAGWLPWLAPGGVIALHDYPSKAGVREVVDSRIRKNMFFTEVGQVQKLIAFKRRRE